MRLYDEVIERILALTDSFPGERRDTDRDWPEAGRDNLIFRQDMAYELGGSSSHTYALGATAVTDRPEMIPADEICILGRDLPEITGDVPYARIALVRVAEDALQQGDALFHAVKKIEFVRYHVNPSGFMTRVSTINGRESVRVDRRALADGLDFAAAGSAMLRKFHENPAIEAVRLIFITDPEFPFEQLEEACRETEKITKALDHVLRTELTDCGRCSLQKICEEVEGMRELHFGMQKR